jgi:hypothetical protein
MPKQRGAFSEPICNLATTILHDNSWDPTNLHLPTQNLVPPPRTMDDDVPFGIRKELIVEIKINPRETHEIYIDNMIPLTVDIPGTDNLARCATARLLAIHATARPKHPDKPIPREEMEARNKLSAEAGLEEEKIFFGWHIGFCHLIISLLDNKCIAWMDFIKEILSCGTSTVKELKMMIEHLGYLGAIVPFIYHFLSRLRDL